VLPSRNYYVNVSVSQGGKQDGTFELLTPFQTSQSWRDTSLYRVSWGLTTWRNFALVTSATMAGEGTYFVALTWFL